jgi:arylsulfatase A-like enzyme
MTPSAALKPAPLVTDGFLRWQRSIGARPFFAFLNYFDAHAPYRPPPSARFMYSAEPTGLDRYDAAITFLDAEIGRLADSLRERAVLDNTVVVIVSDHGEQFGEHGLGGHANSLYHVSLDVPLVLRFPPRVPAGTQVRGLASLRDLAATIVDLAGLADEARLPGRSLARLWTQPGAPQEQVIAFELARGLNVNPAFPNANGPMAAVYVDGLKYIRDGEGREALFDIAGDSAEERDLAGAPEREADLRRARAALDSALAAPRTGVPDTAPVR